MTDSYQILNELRKYYRIVGDPLSLTFVHERLKKRFKISSKEVARHLSYLHKTLRIEFSDNRIKPVGELKNGVATEKDIKSILLDKKRIKPTEAYRYFLEKFNVFVNPESFTRLMRRMAEDGLIHRDEKGYYSLKEYSQMRLRI